VAELTISGGRSRLARYLPRLGFSLAVLSAVLLALAPIGWRAGLWHFRTSFWYLMEPAAFVAAAALLASVIALFWWAGMSGAGRLLALFGLAGSVVLVYYPLQFYAKVQPLPLIHNTPLPRIHDITTDPDDPPVFAATLPARAAENGNTTTYAGRDLARRQQGAYPDVAPLRTALPPPEAFRRALATAQGMSRWTIVKSDPAAGTIEGSERTLFMGFTDDFVIRVSADGAGSRVDMRSESRQGQSDFGVNAKRIRAFLAALRPRLD
jgi:uncharacterized protein (DUF1499 family)